MQKKKDNQARTRRSSRLSMCRPRVFCEASGKYQETSTVVGIEPAAMDGIINLTRMG